MSLNIKSLFGSRSNNLKVVVIGGGTGLSVLLRGLKLFTRNITAIVTVADDGGGSGILRQDLGILPPGDIRNCILALAEAEPLICDLLNYRFEEGNLKGQSFGNLFLAAMNGISSNFEEAVKHMSDVLKVTGRVLPVTLDNVDLSALLENGKTVIGESRIPYFAKEEKSKIQQIRLLPADVKPLPDALAAIEEAELIVLGPGSLYTSIIPNLLVDGIPEAIKASNAATVYVCNVMTQAYESENYTAHDHYRAIVDHLRRNIVDYCVINTMTIPDYLAQKYSLEDSTMVIPDLDRFKNDPVATVTAEIVSIHNDLVRHDTNRLAQLLIRIGLLHKKGLSPSNVQDMLS